jgi:signal transduction histidine kinase
MITEEVPDKMPDSHRTCIYRVVQEALNNCAKHSKATQVRVFVKQDEDGMWVSVEDDGIGFDPAQERGMGLLGMEERVARLGGLFSIESTSGSGTILSIRFPLPDSQPQLSTNGVL